MRVNMTLDSLDEISRFLWVCTVVCVTYLMAFVVSRSVGSPCRRRPRDDMARVGGAARWFGSAGVALAILSPAAAVAAGRPGGPRGSSTQAATPPWEAASSPVEGFRPETGSGSSRRPWESVKPGVQSSPTNSRGPKDAGESSAPPWSGDDGSSPPRPSRRAGAAADARRASAAGGSRAPRETVIPSPADAAPSNAGEAVRSPERREWRVDRGDTLWDIAAQVLATSDRARIARYWPTIHRANHDVIGANPSLIFPGQILRLPAEGRQR
jgi:resuscitation-promoting factor RpfA